MKSIRYTILLLLTILVGANNFSYAQLRINEIGYSGVDVQGVSKWVEIYNAGSAEIDVSSYWLCNFPAYEQISSLTVLEGNTTIPAGGYLVVAFDDTGDGDGEMGLYSGSSFGSAADMVDYMQYGSAAHQREPVAVEAGVWDAGAFVAAAESGQSLSFFDNGGASVDNWASADATPGAENPQAVAEGLRINEVGYSGVDVQGASKWVEIYNGGSDEIDVSSYWLCNFPAYEQINSLTVLEGSTTIPAGGYLVVAFEDTGDGDGEMGLYSGNGFANAADMVDYMQYGSAGHQREPVAVEAGLWEAGAFVAAAPSGETLSFFDNGGAAVDNWVAAGATPGLENAEAVAEVLRINEVGYSGVEVQGAAKWVEIYNEGDSDFDASSYWLCNFPAYAQISSLTVLEGNTTIPAGGYLVVAFDDTGDGDGEMGLYSSNDFGSAAAMVDYMQYGSADHQREPVAVEAGVWEAGAFVAAAPSGESLSFFDNGGALVDNWAAASPSAGTQNSTGTSSDTEETLPGTFTLLGHYPEPFNPTTTVVFDLREAASVQIGVFDLLGRQVLLSSEQAFGPGENQSILLDANGLTSGIYLYRVFARGVQQTSIVTGQMTLLK